jgi:regulator of RNase E activity RraA
MTDANDIHEMARRFREIPSSTIYDTLDSMGYPNQCLSLKIRPLHPEMRIAGPAFTLRGGREPRNHHDEPDMMLEKFHDRGMYRAVYPGCVIVVNSEAEQQCGHFGEMTSYSLRQQGAAGIVIDGGIRDGRHLLQIPNWPVFVRYLSPIESAHRFSANDFEIPIAVTGTLTSQLRIDPGDWIVGDETGVLSVPKKIALEVLEKAEEVESREQKSREELTAGLPAIEVFARYHRT